MNIGLLLPIEVGHQHLFSKVFLQLIEFTLTFLGPFEFLIMFLMRTTHIPVITLSAYLTILDFAAEMYPYFDGKVIRFLCAVLKRYRAYRNADV